MYISKKLILLLFIVLGFYNISFATDRYASPSGSGSTCSLGTPCSLATGTSQTVVDDRLFLRAGNYPVSAESIVPNSGTSWNNVVTIARYQNEVVTLSRFPFATSTPGNNIRYVVFDGLTITCVGCSAGTDGLSVSQGNGPIRFINGEIKNAPGNGVQLSSLSVGGNQFINCRLTNNGTFTPAAFHGIYISSSDNIVDGCDIYDNARYGVHVYLDTHTVHRNIIRNNKIHNNNRGGSSAAGIILGAGDGNTAYNNIIYNNPGDAYGIQVDSSSPLNAKVYHNTIYNNGGEGILVQGATNTDIKNNILYNNGGQFTIISSTGTTYGGNWCGSSGTGCENSGIVNFVNAPGNDFHISDSSLVCGKGVDLNAIITVDIEGISRPDASTPGAYECTSGTEPPNPDPGTIVLDFEFNTGTGTSVVDSAGANNTGTWSECAGDACWGAAMTGAFSGVFNASRHISVATLTDLQPTDAVAVLAWINMSSVGANGCVLGAMGSPYGLYIRPDGTPAGWIDGTGGYVEPVTTQSVLTGTNTLVAMSFNAFDVRVYINAAQVGFSATTQTLTYPGGEGFWVGDWEPDPIYACIGRVGRVTVLNGYCDAACITNYYNSQLPTDGVSVVHHRAITDAAMPMFLGALDGDISHQIDQTIGMQFSISNNSGSQIVEHFHFFCSKNAGAYTKLTDSLGSFGAKIASSSFVAMGDPVTPVFPLGGLTPVNGRIVAALIDPALKTTLPNGGVTEWRYILGFGAPAVATDTFDCKPHREDNSAMTSYASIPRITLTDPLINAVTAGGTQLGGTRR